MLEALGVNDPLLDIAKRLEEVALKDAYFIERKLYPNVDFYSGIIMRAIGIPTDMFTVMFAIGRMPGWIANWREVRENPDSRIYRPRQIYQGPTKRRTCRSRSADREETTRGPARGSVVERAGVAGVRPSPACLPP